MSALDMKAYYCTHPGYVPVERLRKAEAENERLRAELAEAKRIIRADLAKEERNEQ